MYTIAATIRKSNIASAATTARTKRLATPIFRKVPASSVMVNRSPGRTATKHRTGVWKPLFRRIIGLCPVRESTDRGCRSQKAYARKGLISPLHGVLGKAAHLGIRILQKLPHNKLWRAAVRRKSGANGRIGATSEEFRYRGDVALIVVLHASGYIPVYPTPISLNDLAILIPFQDETNNATLSSWQDHEEPMSSWSHPLGRLCSKPRTSGNSGKPWRCCSQRM